MRKLFSILIVFFSFTALSQSFTISGYVTDKSNGESAVGTNVYVKETMQGTNTNAYGFYSLTLPKGNYTFICSSLGYITVSDTINLIKNISKNSVLEPQGKELAEVEVKAENEKNTIRIENSFSILKNKV